MEIGVDVAREDGEWIVRSATTSRTAGITALGSAALMRSTIESRRATAAVDVSTSALIRRPR